MILLGNPVLPKLRGLVVTAGVRAAVISMYTVRLRARLGGWLLARVVVLVVLVNAYKRYICSFLLLLAATVGEGR